jgi:hypothetical protein
MSADEIHAFAAEESFEGSNGCSREPAGSECDERIFSDGDDAMTRVSRVEVAGRADAAGEGDQ